MTCNVSPMIINNIIIYYIKSPKNYITLQSDDFLERIVVLITSMWRMIIDIEWIIDFCILSEPFSRAFNWYQNHISSKKKKYIYIIICIWRDNESHFFFQTTRNILLWNKLGSFISYWYRLLVYAIFENRSKF